MGRILKPLLDRDPDIIVLQEVNPDGWPGCENSFPVTQVHEFGQFWLASRLADCRGLRDRGSSCGTASARPAGPIELFNVHPISPRDGLETVRGNGLRHQFLRGDLFNTRARTVVAQNTAIRLSQLQGMADTARSATPQNRSSLSATPTCRI